MSFYLVGVIIIRASCSVNFTFTERFPVEDYSNNNRLIYFRVFNIKNRSTRKPTLFLILLLRCKNISVTKNMKLQKL